MIIRKPGGSRHVEMSPSDPGSVGRCAVGHGYLAAATAQTGASSHLDAMKSMYRREPPQPIANQPLVDLGRALFFDPALSASGKTACVTCHLPQFGWAVTDQKSKNDSGKLTSRRSQPLIGMGHIGSAPVGWDGRNPTLEAQVISSVATGSMSMNATPTPVKVEVIEERFRSDAAYVAKFKVALPDAPINIQTIAQAIAAFERTLDPAVAPFDRWIEGDETAISESAKRGFELYNGKACASPATGAGASPTTCSTTLAPRPPTAAAAPCSRTTRRCNSRSRRRRCATSRCGRRTCTTACK